MSGGDTVEGMLRAFHQEDGGVRAAIVIVVEAGGEGFTIGGARLNRRQIRDVVAQVSAQICAKDPGVERSFTLGGGPHVN